MMLIATFILVFDLSGQVQRNTDMNIWASAKEGDANRTKALIEQGIDINAVDEDGDTALMIAAYYGRTEVVQVLLEAGADANRKQRYGGTALMSAAFKGHTETVKMLLLRGADVNAKTYDGSTALILAVTNRLDSALGIIDTLLANGADINEQDAQGWTALMHAVSGPPAPPEAPPGYEPKVRRDIQVEIVKTLLAKGADPNSKAVDGSTPLKVAKEVRHSELVDLLKRTGARE